SPSLGLAPSRARRNSLQASTYGREVVGSARSGHVSSHQLGRVLGGALWPAGWGETDRKVVNFVRQVSAFPRGHIAKFWAIKCRRDPGGRDRIARCGGIAPERRHIRDRGRRRHGPGVWHWRALYPLPPQRA